MAYERPLLVRFQDVDYARVVFYPKFFEYAHGVFEDFFADEVGCAYGEMLTGRNVGYPSVHAEADFSAPFRFAERLRVLMDTTRVTSRSVTCRYRFFADGDPKERARVTVVVAPISLDTFTGVDLPADVKAAFERHLVESAPDAG